VALAEKPNDAHGSGDRRLAADRNRSEGNKKCVNLCARRGYLISEVPREPMTRRPVSTDLGVSSE
jgi:hypothetical protein